MTAVLCTTQHPQVFSEKFNFSDLAARMAGITLTLVRSVLGAVLGMFFFGYNTGVVNAPEAAIKKFVNEV